MLFLADESFFHKRLLLGLEEANFEPVTHRQALMLLVLTAVLWSMGGLFIKSVALHPLAIAGLRSFVAGLVVIVYIRRLQFTWSRAQWGSAICFALTVGLFVAATKLTTSANAILLQYTAPIYVALLSVPVLKERVTGLDWSVLAIVVCGMVIFFAEQVSPQHMWGNLIAVGSGVAFAGLAVCLRLQRGQSTLESILLGHLIMAVIGIPFLAAGPWPSGSDILFLLVLGIFQLGIPYLLYGAAIAHVTALEASLILVVEPVLNPLWVALFLGESPSRNAYLGGSLVVFAVVFHSVVRVLRRSTSNKIYAPD